MKTAEDIVEESFWVKPEDYNNINVDMGFLIHLVHNAYNQALEDSIEVMKELPIQHIPIGMLTSDDGMSIPQYGITIDTSYIEKLKK